MVDRETHGFTRCSEEDLADIIQKDPRTLLVFRTITGLTRGEFAHSTTLASTESDLRPISLNKVESMESRGTLTTQKQAGIVAKSLSQIMNKALFGSAPGGLISKQDKPDTKNGWRSVQEFASNRVPFSIFLHQRHYGGAFRQILDATSTLRGNIIEDAVEALFKKHKISYIRTGAHKQHEIAGKFEVQVTPAPDFVVFDDTGLKAILECKGANDGGTARDKALRFKTLKAESIRLGGIPLVAVLGGIGWARVNDTLGPVIRDSDGRVFTLSTLSSLLEVAPFSSLMAAD